MVDLRAVLWLFLPDLLDNLVFLLVFLALFFCFRRKVASAEQQKCCLAQLWVFCVLLSLWGMGGSACPGDPDQVTAGAMHCPGPGLLLLLGQGLL